MAWQNVSQRWETTLSPASDGVSAIYFTLPPFKCLGFGGLKVEDSFSCSYASSLSHVIHFLFRELPQQVIKLFWILANGHVSNFSFHVVWIHRITKRQPFKPDVDKKDKKEASLLSCKGIFPFMVIIKHMSHLSQLYILLTKSIVYNGSHRTPLKKLSVTFCSFSGNYGKQQ